MEQLHAERKKKVEKFIKGLDPGVSNVSLLSLDRGASRVGNGSMKSKKKVTVPPTKQESNVAAASDHGHDNANNNHGDASLPPSPNTHADAPVGSSSLSKDSPLDKNADTGANTPSVESRQRALSSASHSRSVSTSVAAVNVGASSATIKVKHGRGRQMSISLEPSGDDGDERSRSIGAGMTLYVDVDVKRLNKTLWRRIHQYLIQESPIKYLFLLSCLLLLAPAVDTGRSPTLRCWIGDQCLRQWEGTAAVLAVFAGMLLLFIFCHFCVMEVLFIVHLAP